MISGYPSLEGSTLLNMLQRSKITYTKGKFVSWSTIRPSKIPGLWKDNARTSRPLRNIRCHFGSRYRAHQERRSGNWGSVLSQPWMEYNVWTRFHCVGPIPGGYTMYFRIGANFCTTLERVRLSCSYIPRASYCADNSGSGWIDEIRSCTGHQVA